MNCEIEMSTNGQLQGSTLKLRSFSSWAGDNETHLHDQNCFPAVFIKWNVWMISSGSGEFHFHEHSLFPKQLYNYSQFAIYSKIEWNCLKCNCNSQQFKLKIPVFHQQQCANRPLKLFVCRCFKLQILKFSITPEILLQNENSSPITTSNRNLLPSIFSES